MPAPPYSSGKYLPNKPIFLTFFISSGGYGMFLVNLDRERLDFFFDKRADRCSAASSDPGSIQNPSVNP